MPVPISGRILLVVSPASRIEPLFDLMARLAEGGTLYALDGGNAFQGYRLAEIMRARSAEYAALLARVMLARVFTCYQMLALLSEDQFGAVPILMLDFLATFYDQSVPVGVRRRLLRTCLARLAAFSQRAPVVIWVKQRTAIPQEALTFLDVVQASVGEVWSPLPVYAPHWQQTGLWGDRGSLSGWHES